METMRDDFRGIVAVPQETTSGQQSWPASESNSHYSANLAKINTLISMPEVDTSRVYLLGYSNGGFFTYLLACTIGDRIAAAGVLAGLKEVPPTCPHRTSMVHFHDAADPMNIPVDPPAGGKGGSTVQHGTPASLRADWLTEGSGSTGSTTNGPNGVTTGDFTLYSATADGKRYEYWSYSHSGGTHNFDVYPTSPLPAGAPGGMGQEPYMMQNFFGM